jgi:hypothetical protein
MPRFYFHVLNDVETIDAEGAEFPHISAAIARAEREVRILAAESVKAHGHIVLSHCIQIEDEDGHAVAYVRFGDAIEIRPLRWPVRH